MDSEIKIPFATKRVLGPSQKGDRIWNSTRWALVRKGYPFAGDSGAVIIRRCVVEQTEIPQTVQLADDVEIEVWD